MSMSNVSADDWDRLKQQADIVSEQTGWGLAATWGCIHRGEYDEAVARINEVIDVNVRLGKIQPGFQERLGLPRVAP